MKKLFSLSILTIISFNVFAINGIKTSYDFMSDIEKNQMYFMWIIMILITNVVRRIYNNIKKQKHDYDIFYIVPILILILGIIF